MTVGGMGFIPERLLMMMMMIEAAGSGLVLRCLGPGFTVLALGPGFRPIIIKRLKQLGSINNPSPNRYVHGFFRPVPF